MTREIKFRAWDKKNKRMRYWDTLRLENYFIDGVYGLVKIFQLGENLSYTSETDLILMQFTGLFDKNGVRIYEGDILKTFWEGFKNKYWYVDFNYGQFVLINDMGREFNFDLNWENGNQTEYEVIGNIYEDSNFLRQNEIS